MSELRPSLHGLTRGQLLLSALSIVAAVLLLGTLGVRIVARVDLWQWWVPLAFLGASLAILTNALLEQPASTAFGFAIILLGVPVYYLWRALASGPVTGG